MKSARVFVVAFLLTAPAFASPHGDCYHACNSACWDAIEQYENQIGGCTNGAASTGPVPGLCNLFWGPPLNRVAFQTVFCEHGAGCSITGRMKCGSAANQRPEVPRIPQDGPGGINCPPRWHPVTGNDLPAVVIHEDSGVCLYPDGTMIGWECDAAGTGVDAVVGTYMGGGSPGGVQGEAAAILP